MTNPMLLGAWKVWRLVAYGWGWVALVSNLGKLIWLPGPFDEQWSKYYTYNQAVENHWWFITMGFIIITGTRAMDYILRER
jgi:hypothetical protein